MSNYTQITFFAPKDALLTGDPNKKIKGAQVDPELAAIAVAIASKFDSSSISSAPVLFADGTAGAPSIAFASATGTGLYKPAANSLGFAAAGVAAGSISSVGSWTIGPAAASNVSLGVNGASGTFAVAVNGNSTSGSSFGLQVAAGTTAADVALLVFNQAFTIRMMEIFGDGHGFIGANITNNLSWNTAGNFTIAAPTSGTPLTINGPASSSTVLLLSAGASGGAGVHVNDGTGNYIFGSGVLVAGVWSIYDSNAGSERIKISANGAVTINGPSGASTSLSVISGAANAESLDLFGTASATASCFQRYSAQNGAALGYVGVSGSAQLLIAGGSAGDLVFRADNGGIAFSPNAGASTVMRITPSNGIAGLGPVNTGMVDMTPDTSSFTATGTGFSSGGTASCSWVRMGKMVTMTIQPLTGTSNATTFTITGLPAAIQPANTQGMFHVWAENNGVNATEQASISGGTITLYLAGNASGWTNGGGKGLPNGATFAYVLD